MKVKWYLLILINVVALIKIFVFDWNTITPDVYINDIWLNISMTIIASELLGVVGALLFIGLGQLIYHGFFVRIYDGIKYVLNYKIP